MKLASRDPMAVKSGNTTIPVLEMLLWKWNAISTVSPKTMCYQTPDNRLKLKTVLLGLLSLDLFVFQVTVSSVDDLVLHNTHTHNIPVNTHEISCIYKCLYYIVSFFRALYCTFNCTYLHFIPHTVNTYFAVYLFIFILLFIFISI